MRKFHSAIPFPGFQALPISVNSAPLARQSASRTTVPAPQDAFCLLVARTASYADLLLGKAKS